MSCLKVNINFLSKQCSCITFFITVLPEEAYKILSNKSFTSTEIIKTSTKIISENM